MIRPEVIRGVQDRIHDPAAADRELGVLAREGMLEGDSRLADALEAIYRIATRALAEPSDTAALLEICSIVEQLREP